MASITGLSQLVESGGIEGYTPNQTEYANLSLPMNKRFKPSPAFIFYPKTSEEISSIVRLAAQSGVAVTARGGGHHYGAFSSGEGSESSIIIDLKNFNEIRYDVSREIAVIGAGCRLGQISEELSRVGRALPHGTCPSVGIGGHASHGGYGFTSRAWGLLCDRVTEHEVVLADGAITRASDSTNEGLFWALKGAGPSFGIITSFKMKTEPQPKVSVVFRFTWNMNSEEASGALMKYQAWLPDVPAGLGMGFLYGKGNEADTLKVEIEGQFLGDLKSFHQTVDQPMAIIGGAPVKQVVKEYDWLKALEWLSIGTETSDAFYAKSFVVKEEAPLVIAQARSLADYAISVGNKTKTEWFIMADNWGGRESVINVVPLEATSFGSRSNLFAFQLFARSQSRQPPFPTDGIELVNGMWNALAEPSGGERKHSGFANYVDAEFTASQAHEAYYGSQLPRLRELKKKFDPNNVLRFKHSIIPVE